ncbi:MAG: TIGR00730 family Rossman fold protein [Luteolibacter sp.]
MRRICIYAGSSFGGSPEYSAAAAAFGSACARRGLGIVYGGGSVGLMGVLADSALAAGGEVIGVIPRRMIAEERGHHGVSELIAVDSMHERKQRMAELSDAFVALPGGIGTLEEVIEVFTWLQLGLHLKPVGLLNVGGFHDPLLQFLARMRDEEFLTDSHHDMLVVEADSERLLDILLSTRHTLIPKPVHHPDRDGGARRVE